jgi:2-oxoisovalerate dehydrogenase E2 component (dihydrolipoyl transacylase)
MSEFVVRLPDVGEGVAEAELVSWQVAVGDVVTQDTVLAGKVGDVLAIGGNFVGIETAAEGAVSGGVPGVTPATEPMPNGSSSSASATIGVAAQDTDVETGSAPVPASSCAAGGQSLPPLAGDPALAGTAPAKASVKHSLATARDQVLAAPAVRERARQLAADLTAVVGTGPDSRITHDDLDRFLAAQRGPASQGAPSGDKPIVPGRTSQIPLLGVRRMIAARMSNSASRIPHITYVEEIDMTQIELTRRSLATLHPTRSKASVLPFVMRAIVLAVVEQPTLNATFDDTAEMLTTYQDTHIGIATQTPNGLMVPVVRRAQALDLWQSADELARVTSAAREGRATRDELSGSTITITSLGALGGLVTTPIINHPEVAIIGINKLQVRPVWSDGAFVPRTMMNLSSSFDHRIVDGWDAATFIQRIKLLLEDPALLFIDPPG